MCLGSDMSLLVDLRLYYEAPFKQRRMPISPFSTIQRIGSCLRMRLSLFIQGHCAVLEEPGSGMKSASSAPGVPISPMLAAWTY